MDRRTTLEGHDLLAVLATFVVAWVFLLLSGDVERPKAGPAIPWIALIISIAHTMFLVTLSVFGVVGVIENIARAGNAGLLCVGVVASMAAFAVVSGAWVVRSIVELRNLQVAASLLAVAAVAECLAIRKLVPLQKGTSS